MTWTPVDGDAGVWGMAAIEHGVPNVRATAVRLRDGGVVVISPIRATSDADLTALAALGPVRFLLAPNMYHNMGIDRFAAHFPDCTAVATDKTRARLTGRIRTPVAALDDLRPHLPEHVTLLVPEGTRNGEVFVRVQTARGVAWVVGDAFFHMARIPTGAPGLFIRAMDVGPGLRLGCTFKWIALADRPAYAHWVRAQLDADQPRILVPGHGEVLEADDLADLLRAQVDHKLRG